LPSNQLSSTPTAQRIPCGQAGKFYKDRTPTQPHQWKAILEASPQISVCGEICVIKVRRTARTQDWPGWEAAVSAAGRLSEVHHVADFHRVLTFLEHADQNVIANALGRKQHSLNKGRMPECFRDISRHFFGLSFRNP